MTPAPGMPSQTSSHPTCRAPGCLEPPADGDWCPEHAIAVELIRESVLAKSMKRDKNGNRWYAR